jgi:excisionase family DNA binding protein
VRRKKLMDTPKFYTIDEASLILRVSRITIYRKRKTGEIKTIKFGRRILIPASFLERLEITNSSNQLDTLQEVE